MILRTVITIAVLASSCTIPAAQKEQAENIKPNIIFIMSDDHASAAIRSYGSKIINTPNIDRIANQGIRFTNAFPTSSLCSPSRAAIISGQYGSRSGFKRIGDVFDGSKETLPKLLQKGGYETAIFGKWHLGSAPTGFNYYEVVRGQGKFFDPRFHKNGMDWNKKVKSSADVAVSPGYFTDVITDKSIGWIEERKSDRPFALFVHHKAPHAPHLTPEKYHAYFKEDLPKPNTFDDTFDGKNSFLKDTDLPYSKLENANEFDVFNSPDQKTAPSGIEKGTNAYKDWAYQTLFKGYYRQITSIDDNVGRLLDYLEETGLDKHTIIVYTSDNGWFLGDHGLFNKMWMYEESLKIPLIISYADNFSGDRVDDHLVSILDFAPTFLDYAGVEIPSFMQGRSLRPLLEEDKTANWRKRFFYHYYDQWGVPEHYGVRTQNYKLIQFLDSTQTAYELYDLKADPKELLNVFDVPKYTHIREGLLKALQEEKERFE